LSKEVLTVRNGAIPSHYTFSRVDDVAPAVYRLYSSVKGDTPKQEEGEEEEGESEKGTAEEEIALYITKYLVKERTLSFLSPLLYSNLPFLLIFSSFSSSAPPPPSSSSSM
jgi:hypothetical protein